MDFREYEVIREGDEIVVVGTIRDPVHWDFSIRLCEDDLAGVVSLAVQRPFVGFLLRALLRRRKKNHWTQEIGEHLAEGKRRRVTAREKGQQRIDDAQGVSGKIAEGAAV